MIMVKKMISMISIRSTRSRSNIKIWESSQPVFGDGDHCKTWNSWSNELKDAWLEEIKEIIYKF